MPAQPQPANLPPDQTWFISVWEFVATVFTELRPDLLAGLFSGLLQVLLTS
jgi:hypothetical protein